MAGPNLTQEEAAERAATVSVDRYDVDVDLTGMLEGPTLRTVSRIAFTAAPGATTFVECRGAIERVALNGRRVADEDVGAGRIVLRDLATVNELVVAASQDGTAEQAGVHRTVDPVDGAAYVWMAFEPYDAHRAWACFDQPDLKAPHRFTVTAPRAWAVLSNTAAERVEDAAEGARRWWFPDTPPLSTYVVNIDAGPFVERRRETRDHSLGLHFPRSRAATFEREAEFLLDLTERGLALFAERFGAPFPQQHYEQVFVADMPGALETWGCVTYGDHLVRDAPTYADRSLVAEVLLHEMAHQWFGDLVTMRWWDDLWLNEAFASWAAAWALEQVDDRFATRWAEFAVGRKLAARTQDRGPATHPISTPVADTSSAFASFDMITYAKGQTVLKQLAAFVGEDDFLAGLRDYFAAHAWANATIDDLLDALGRASGRDLTAWADAWLRRAGTDALSVEAGHVVVRSPDDHGPRPHRVVVGALVEDGTGDLVLGATADVETGPDPVPLDLPADAVILWPDVGDHSFVAARLSAEELATAVARVADLPGTMERAQLLAMTRDMLVAGEADAGLVVSTATRVARAEDRPAIVGPTLDLAVGAAETWSASGQREDLVTQVADCAADLVDGGAVGLVALHALARTCTTADHLALLRDAGGLSEDEELDLRWRVLVRRSQLGHAVDEEVESLAARDGGSTAARRAAVLAGRADTAANGEVWRQVVVDREIRSPADLQAIAASFWQRDQAAIVRPFADRWIELARAIDDEQFWFSTTLQRMAPTAVVDQRLLDDMAAALDDGDLHPSARQLLTLATDTGRRVLVARGRASQ